MSPAKPSLELVTTLIAEALALQLTYQIYQASGPAVAFFAGVPAVWLAYKVSTLERLWHTLGMMLNPMKSLLLVTAVALVYFGVQGFALPKLLLTGLGFTFIGASLAFLAYGYWNIA